MFNELEQKSTHRSAFTSSGARDPKLLRMWELLKGEPDFLLREPPEGEPDSFKVTANKEEILVSPETQADFLS